MAMTRIWNVSDDERTNVRPQTVMVLGKPLKPGKYVKVDEALLKRAHKVKKDVGNKLLFIGLSAPKAYADKKNPPRAKLPKSVNRAHGLTHAAISEEAVKKVDKVLTDKVEVTEEAAVEAKPAEEPKPKPKKGRFGKKPKDSDSE